MRKKIQKKPDKEKKYSDNSFPYNIIDGIAGRFTETYCSKLEVPPEFMYMSFLTCLGTLFASSLTIATQIKPQPRLYVLFLGQSAEERKSTAIKETIKFFEYALRQEQNQSRQLHTCHGVGSAEGLAKILKKNSNLLLCYDEFKAFISKAKIRNSNLLQCINTLFESNQYENQTSKAEIVVNNGRLSFLAASTTQTYEAAWDASFTAIGFNNRLFVVPGNAERKFSIPPEISIIEKDILASGVYKMIKFVGKFRKLTLTNGAKKLYHNWYMTRPPSIHSKRLDGYALRFMELFAANRMVSVVDEGIVNNAIELMDWEFEMRQLHDPIDADNTIAKMEEKIRRALSRRNPETGDLVSLGDRKLKQVTNANRSGLYFYSLGLKNLRNADEIAFDSETRLWSLVEEE